MTIQEIEEAIIGRLKEKISGVAIEGFPEKPSEYRLRHAKGALLVSYRGSTFSEPRSTDIVYQERKINFDVTVVMRHLRDHEGAYAYLDAVRVALTGFRVNGGSKMYPTREEFISEEAGIWQYGITFTMTMPAIEIEEQEQIPLLTRITTVDDYGTQTIPNEEV